MRKALLGIFVLLVSVNCGELHQVGSSSSYLIIETMDAAIRDPRNSNNPGTTADLTAASIFATLVAGSW